MGVGGRGFGRRLKGRAWEDSCRTRRLEVSGVMVDELMNPADDVFP
jgi:hypothetical protein